MIDWPTAKAEGNAKQEKKRRVKRDRQEGYKKKEKESDTIVRKRKAIGTEKRRKKPWGPAE